MNAPYPPQQAQGAPPQQQVPQTGGNLPPAVQQFLSDAQQGKHGYVNDCWLAGQIFPARNGSDQIKQTGFEWKPGRNSNSGSLHMNVKLLRTWFNQQMQKEERRALEVRVIIYGDRGQNLLQSLQPGVLVAVFGRFSINSYRDQRGNFKSYPQFVMHREAQSQQNFHIGGMAQLVDDRPQPQNNAQQGNYQQSQGGYYQPPQQGVPPQGQAPQGVPPQGQAPQGVPPQGQPPQGMPPQGPGYNGNPGGYPPQQSGPPPQYQQPQQGVPQPHGGTGLPTQPGNFPPPQPGPGGPVPQNAIPRY